MKLIVLTVSLLCLLLLVLAGCDDSRSTEINQIETGNLTVSVIWPETDQRLIPAETQSILVEVLIKSRAVSQGVVARPSSSLTLENIPSGNVVVRAKAFSKIDGTGSLLASGETHHRILPHQDNPAAVTLSLVPPVITDDALDLGGKSTYNVDETGTHVILKIAMHDNNNMPITDLTKENFIILEDGIEREPTDVVPYMDGKPLDLGIAIDITGSMSMRIDNVRTSVIALVNHLESQGESATTRYTGATFGDDVIEVEPFTNAANFKQWVEDFDFGQGSHENSLDAVMALAKQTNWRPEAHHCIIVITDEWANQAGYGGDTTILHTLKQVLDYVQGNFVIHTFSPGINRSYQATQSATIRGDEYTVGAPSSTRAPGDDLAPIDVQELSIATGGVWHKITDDGTLPITSLPLAATFDYGYIVTFDSVNHWVKHDIRVTIQRNGAYIADRNFLLLY